MTIMKTKAEVLREAASQVQIHGLAKRAFKDEGGCVCTMGAIRKVTTGTAHFSSEKFDLLWELEQSVYPIVAQAIRATESGAMVHTAILQRYEVGHLTSSGMQPIIVDDAELVWDLISEWNDASERTADEVIAVLNNAAELAEKAEV